MTEKNPAAEEQALPTRRARRAVQSREGSAPADSAGERRQAQGRAPGRAEPPARDEEAPLTRRRARAELRSWGSSAAPDAGNGYAVDGSPSVLVDEQDAAGPQAPEDPEPGFRHREDGAPETAHGAPVPGELETALRTDEPWQAETYQEQASREEPQMPETPQLDWPAEEYAPEPPAPVSTDAESTDAESPGAEPRWEPSWDATEQADAPESGSEHESAPEPEPEPEPEADVEPESAAEAAVQPAPAPDAGEDSQRLAVVLPEPPAAPPAGPQQEIEIRGSGSIEPYAGHPSGLPLEPAQMPVDLRERTRAAVRGEPNDVRRATFLDTQTAKIPAARGFRGFLASLGIRIAPSARELEERRDTRIVSQHWPGPRTISVVNGKGGANKTPTTVMLAAIFARNGGGPVLAWDNNETRGTLGWRTEQAQHDATVMDLLPETGLLLSPAAQSAMLAKFVHHQTDDKYDVLRSNPNVLASEQKVTKADFDALHSVASKYFRLNVVDSGNDESAERWLRMIDHTDQLVIATTTVEEHAEAGALLLEALQERGGKYAELARGAVVIVSQADRNGTEAQARRVAEAFKVLARAAVTIPYDPALVKGQIRYASLRPATQRAWLRAAAAVAGGL
ncbi:AAA family ATPase [Arthrobacter koreensis]|uniref:AAA family ATPase n=1 Tax=Arthrobacter koreensis TaxID=199136 RepID=UPI002DBEFB41|nr:AAA family ATPase [Arthrobacter koreensis]MEB7503701.1 AAA family ATPase [Arthrobacter koreensis]